MATRPATTAKAADTVVVVVAALDPADAVLSEFVLLAVEGASVAPGAAKEEEPDVTLQFTEPLLSDEDELVGLMPQYSSNFLAEYCSPQSS